MPVFPSQEFKGIAFKYDPTSQPFFKAIVKENLRMLRALPHGAALLKAIKHSNPGYRNNEFPRGCNVLLQPPMTRDWKTPGLGSQGITDQKKYDDFQGGIGGMIPTMSSKTSAQEVNPGSAMEGGPGTVCWLFYSNNEIITKNGEWLPPHITLGHELIHCIHALNGEMKRDHKEEEWATVGLKGFGGTYTENQLRADANIPLRVKYFSDD